MFVLCLGVLARRGHYVGLLFAGSGAAIVGESRGHLLVCGLRGTELLPRWLDGPIA